jgi:hypothetical protein
MGGRPLASTVEKPIPAAQAVPSSATVVSFYKLGRPRAKFEPITTPRSSKVVMPPASAAAEGSTSGSNGPKGVIIHFAHADRGVMRRSGINIGRTRTKPASRQQITRR